MIDEFEVTLKIRVRSSGDNEAITIQHLESWAAYLCGELLLAASGPRVLQARYDITVLGSD
jgi:hypothetical protein